MPKRRRRPAAFAVAPMLLSAIVVAACGRSSDSPTGPSSSPSPLEAAVARAYTQAFGESIPRPAVFSSPCANPHVTTTAYLGPRGATSTLLELYLTTDGNSVTRQQRRTVVTPTGNFRVLTVLGRYPETVGDDTLTLWENAQRAVNEDHASYARARGYATPLVTFTNTTVVLDPPQIGNPRNANALNAALQQVGLSSAGYDFLVSVNPDPKMSEGGFAQTGSTPAFIFMGNFSLWTTRLTQANLTSIAGAVYHHEVPHHWGWPGTHDWDTCNVNDGFNFRVPPLLLGWEDVDGDGVPEVLDSTPYGRTGR